VSAQEPSERRAGIAVAARRAEPPAQRPPQADDQQQRGRLHLGVIGLCGGLFSGLLGLGGGVVMVPLLVLWARFGQRDAHAVSLGAIIPISAAGVLTFGAAGEVHFQEAVLLALGAIGGAQVGARVLARANEQTLKLAFGVFLLLVAAVLVVAGD
jgi:uncharacterized protein